MLNFKVLEKQKFEEGKKTYVKDLIYFMLILNQPEEGAKISKFKNIY